MNRVGLVLAVLCLSTAPAPAASPDPKALAIPPAERTKAQKLVTRLASADFAEREEAQGELARMGRTALPALIEGLNSHPSPEVRFRCQSLLPRAAADDLQARLDTFLADEDGKFDHDLPGWNEFRAVAGQTAAARKVFVELLADGANRPLVLAVGGPKGELGDLVAARKQELYSRKYQRVANVKPREPEVPDVIALAFAEAQAPSKVVPRSISMSVLFSSVPVRTAVTAEGTTGDVYRAVVADWMATRDEPVSVYQAMSVASQLNMPREAGSAAGKLLTMNGASWSYRANAAMSIARTGAKEQLPALEKAFADKTVLPIRRVIAGRAEPVESQVRDIALAAALMLTDQDPEEYGFRRLSRAASATARFSYSHWQLPADDRTAAFDKWKAWRAKNPDFGKVEGKK